MASNQHRNKPISSEHEISFHTEITLTVSEGIRIDGRQYNAFNIGQGTGIYSGADKVLI